MPQIYLKIAPVAQSAMTQEVLKEIDEEFSERIWTLWSIPENDVAFSAENLIYTRGEADIQIEIRYTAGTDEYNKGELFDLDKGKQRLLSDSLGIVIKRILTQKNLSFSVSVWIKPSYHGIFRPPSV